VWCPACLLTPTPRPHPLPLPRPLALHTLVLKSWRTRVRFCVNLSLFFGSRLRCTSVIRRSRQADRCGWRSGGWEETICALSWPYICKKGSQG
jgi:hypothetical protein